MIFITGKHALAILSVFFAFFHFRVSSHLQDSGKHYLEKQDYSPLPSIFRLQTDRGKK
jgi:hypothetical protein